MIEPLTGFHEMRSNPQIMIKGKAAPFFLPKRELQGAGSDDATAKATQPSQKMGSEELRALQELKLRDSAVREEEESHARMLGRHAGPIRYEYQIGPDGRAYVINGSVEVNPKLTSNNPEEIRKVLQTIQRAAVTVSNPSQADLNIAASAASKVSTLGQHTVINAYLNGVESQSTGEIPRSDSLSSNQLDTQA